MSRHVVIALSLMILAATQASAQNTGPGSTYEDLLQQGKLGDAEQLLVKNLQAKPGNDDARFALGVVQFLRAVEGRMQSFYRHGCKTDPQGPISFSNLPIPQNPRPEPLDYKTARDILQAWIDDLTAVEATLAKVTAPGVKLPIAFGLIRLDFDGDGKLGEDETLWKVYGKFNRAVNVSAEAAKTFVVACDRGDVDWLRGYCHVLSALTEALLAHDFEDLFHRTGYLLFEGIKPPHAFLVGPKPPENTFDISGILDLIAMIHLVRLPVAEPARLVAVVKHMEAMVTLSRSSWSFILAETDNDREWLPNPKQASVVPNVQVTAEMVEGWTRFLDEFDAILKGKTLAPFWRGQDPKRGINVRRVFTEPRPLDMVLWFQGSAAAPYLEEGQVSSAETWGRINRIFHGEFIGFALWFN